MQVDAVRCIGCGLCLAACPEQAVSLEPKPEAGVPPRDWDETMAIILAERSLP
jgi:ferredoxin